MNTTSLFRPHLCFISVFVCIWTIVCFLNIVEIGAFAHDTNLGFMTIASIKFPRIFVDPFVSLAVYPLSYLYKKMMTEKQHYAVWSGIVLSSIVVCGIIIPLHSMSAYSGVKLGSTFIVMGAFGVLTGIVTWIAVSGLRQALVFMIFASVVPLLTLTTWKGLTLGLFSGLWSFAGLLAGYVLIDLLNAIAYFGKVMVPEAVHYARKKIIARSLAKHDKQALP